jgi:acyl dehydratase
MIQAMAKARGVVVYGHVKKAFFAGSVVRTRLRHTAKETHQKNEGYRSMRGRADAAKDMLEAVIDGVVMVKEISNSSRRKLYGG